MRCSFVGKGRGRHRVGSSWSSPLPGRRLGHSCCQMSAFWERIRGQGTEFTMMLSSPGWEEVWRLKAPKENLWDARPRKEMRIALGHPRAFNFVTTDFELTFLISNLCLWYWCVLLEGYRQTAAATAAAKLLQSCPTLCDPRDGSPPGSPVPGILQARTLEWVAISFSNRQTAVYIKGEYEAFKKNCGTDSWKDFKPHRN